MKADEGELLEAARRLEDAADRLVAEQLRVLRAMPSYERVPVDDLVRSCRRNVVRVVTTLRGETQLPPDVVEDERVSGRRRALQGIPGEDVVAAYRAVLGVLRDAFLVEVTDLDVPRDAVLLGIQRLWDVADHFSSELVSARHQVDLDLVRREERERLTFLHNVLTGTLQPAELVEGGGAAYGLGSVRELWVLRARSTSAQMAASDLVASIDRATTTPRFAPLLGLVGGDVAGLVGRRPEDVPADAVVAVDGPVGLSEVHAAFVRATSVLDVGARYVMCGVVTFERLSLRVAVAQNEQLGDMLYERYLGPLDPASSMTPAILGSVGAYLDNGRSIPAASRALNVHVNTLRYRLDRFEQSTGADLSETLTLLEVWWALQYASLRATDDHSASEAAADPRT